jgi:glyoxylase-like metal-dependent hydrolase (beta-lactamase superfamily II)
MIFEELNGDSSCKTYLLASRVDAYVQRLVRDGLKLQLVVDTHTHADHLSGIRELARATGAATAGAPPGLVTRPLRDGDVLELAELKLHVLGTPGHTEDSLVLRMADRVLTGDTLLIGATGRTDLPTGDAELEYRSLQRLLELPDDLLVYPGHDYAGKTVSTIGEERRANKRLLMPHEEFIRVMTAPRSSKPDKLAEALAHNTRPLDRP